MKGAKRIVASLLAMVLCLSALSGCGRESEQATPAATELSVGYAAIDGLYSPFYAESEADRDVVEMTQLRLLSTDRNGRVVTNGIKGETIAYNGVNYTYTGPADVLIISREDGTVDYHFTLRQDLCFADKKPLTANDVIFTMYVLCDPMYDGPVEFLSLPIVGLTEYRRGMTPKWQLMLADTPSAAAEDSPEGYYTSAEAMAFWEAFNRAGEKFAQYIVDWYMAEGKGKTVGEVAALMGYGALPETAQAIDLFNAIVDRHGYDVEAIDSEQVTVSFKEVLLSSLNDVQRQGVKTGSSAKSIKGIKKTGMYTFSVTLEKQDANALSEFCFAIAPLHHYGKSELYNEASGTFGFPKGDLSSVRSKTKAPIGAGPYRLKHQETGLVSLSANGSYYRGRPQIDLVHFKKCVEGSKLSALEKKTIGLTVADFGSEMKMAVERINGGVLNGDVLSTRPMTDTGTGYLGMSADFVNVNGDPRSDASRHLRTGLMMAFSQYSRLAAENHYGSLIVTPTTPFAAEDHFYMVDADGVPIDLSADLVGNREEIVRQAMLGHFAAAGYTVENGRLVAAPEGASLKYEVVLAGGGSRQHPAYLMLTKAKELLASLGIRLMIRDLTGESDVRLQVDREVCRIWCVERGVFTEPDMYTYYFSGGENRPSGALCGMTEISDGELNRLLLAARAEVDDAKRRKLYASCAEIVQTQAVELPLYYRNQAVIGRSDTIDVDTLAKDMTGHYGWIREIEKLKTAG